MKLVLLCIYMDVAFDRAAIALGLDRPRARLHVDRLAIRY